MQSNQEGVYSRDFTAPTLEDHFDKTILPKVMQVCFAVPLVLPFLLCQRLPRNLSKCDLLQCGSSLPAPAVAMDPESTPAGICVFLDPESKICEKPDPESVFIFGCSRSQHGLFYLQALLNFG